ncbi:MAG: phage major capsid protein [Proteobacteria bacterium]|nr:phage major capsid protein [Pseudomonadota bacterium]
MHDYDIQNTLDELARTFEEFKSTQDNRLTNLERKRPVDAFDEEKMARLDASLENAEKRLKQMEAFASRPSVETTADSFSSHQHAFVDYIRKGLDTPLHLYEKKALSTTPDRDGGYLVPSGLHDRLYTTLQATSVMRPLASVREISTSALELLIDKDTTDAGWVTETQERAETRTPDLAKIRIPVHEMYAKPRATQKLLDDALLNVEEWLSQKIAQKIAAMENTAFVRGEGENSPRGLLSYETALRADWQWGRLEEIRTGVNGDFVEGAGEIQLQDTFFALKPPYLPGASWLMSRSAQARIRRLKDAESGRYLWEPPLAGVMTPTLLGYPVIVSDDMPPLVPGEASKAIIFGNFKEGYQIVDRSGIRVLRDPYSAKPYVEFYTTRRVGGDVLNFEALKVVNFRA